MFQFGGGVAIPMGGWSVVGQFDYRRFFAEDGSISSIRFVGGIRLEPADIRLLRVGAAHERVHRVKRRACRHVDGPSVGAAERKVRRALG